MRSGQGVWRTASRAQFYPPNGKCINLQAVGELFRLVEKGWDKIIVGCVNTKVGLLAMMYMRMRHIPFVINLDGETFFGKSLKATVKGWFLKGAEAYVVAGKKCGESLKSVVGNSIKVYPYYFSSLSKEEIKQHAEKAYQRNNTVLVVGQYFPYKGMDVALEAARKDLSIKYKFVGMGYRTDLFLQEMGAMPENVEVIPFLQKAELEEEYKHCAMLLLPTRQECWGLVVNEAASFGTPIVSTWGSGAAVEFLADNYPEYLATPNNSDSLLSCIRKCLSSDTTAYSQYLKDISREYSIDRNVEEHMRMIEE